MKPMNERYEFAGESISGHEGDSGLVIDVIAKEPKEIKEPSPYKGTGIVLMGADEGKEHTIRTFISIKDTDNLLQAQVALELLQSALFREAEENDELTEEEIATMEKVVGKIKNR